LTAPAQPLTQRARPTAFTVVLDRSGSMGGGPIEHAKQACREVIKNLRQEDYFSLVVFDDSAQVIIPLEQPVNRFSWYQTVDQICTGDSTNLMAGWLLGRDELLKAQKTADGIGPIRKILLLTDGHLNAGITEPAQVEALTRAGLEKDEIRTGCLGFGDGYNENILAAMSKVGQGQLHDADSPEKFPVILADELDGLQKITAAKFAAPDQTKTLLQRLETIWRLPSGSITLEGEELVGLEFARRDDSRIFLSSTGCCFTAKPSWSLHLIRRPYFMPLIVSAVQPAVHRFLISSD
jgi:Ca-activated chloride channel family protein